MWEFFINKSRFAYLTLVALIGFGAYAVYAIPKESGPEVQIPVGIVTTVLPGAPAGDVESLVTNEVERGLSGLANMKQITSVSREGVSLVTVEFEASADIDDSIQDLKDAVDAIAPELPSNAEDPFVSEVNFVDQPIMTIAVSGDRSDFAFTEIGDALEAELEGIAGVAKVTVSGARAREITVVVDQAALVRYGVSLPEVTAALQNANLTFPIGQIENNGVSYNIAFDGDIANSVAVENVGITTRGGQPVYVRDIATVVDGLAPAATISRLSSDGAPSATAITLDVYKERGGDITKIARTVNARLTELKEDGELLSGLTSVTVLDSGDLIEKDLKNLTSSGLQTVVLVVLLLIVAIGWREGVLAGLSVPLTLLFGFIGLYLSGNTINFLSLFALILGIGIIVDSSIVMVEGINARMKADPLIDKRQAAILTVREFAAPLISGTLTTVAMFSGLFIVSGVIGQFISSIPFTLIFILLASLFVSLTMIPLLASVFLRRKNTTRFEEQQVAYAHALESWYREKLSHIVGSPSRERAFMWTIRLALLVTLLFPVIGVVKVVFFEQGNVDYIFVEVEYPEGTTKEVTDIAVRRVEEVLYTTPDIASYTVTVGSGSQFGSAGSGEKFANIFINLDPERERTSTKIIEDLRVQLAPMRDVKVTVNQPSDGPPTGAPIVVKFLGDDLDEITGLAQDAAELIRSVPHTTNVETSTNNNNTEFVLTLNREKAAALGVSPFMVSQIARTAVYGADATSITTLENDIDVVVRLNLTTSDQVASDATNVSSIDDVSRIEVPTAVGLVPLGTLVDISLRESSSVITHEDGARVVSVTSDVTAEGNAREIQATVLERIERELTIPDGVTVSAGGGEAEESNQAFLEMFLALIVGAVLMIAVLVLEFNSYLHTRYVLSILPYSLIGIMVGLALTQNPLSFPSIMGFIALSGIVVNNSILLIDMMNRQRLQDPLKPIRDVVIDASVSRLRPILLTTLTTVIGMIPLTLAGDLWAPLAYAVMFGLAFSVVITLVLVPIVYMRKPGTVSQDVH
jgi:multidrug efflux pump subunit AcrB